MQQDETDSKKEAFPEIDNNLTAYTDVKQQCSLVLQWISSYYSETNYLESVMIVMIYKRLLQSYVHDDTMSPVPIFTTGWSFPLVAHKQATTGILSTSSIEHVVN